MVITCAQLRWFIKKLAPCIHWYGISYFSIHRSAQEIVPGGVAAAGAPLRGLKMPIGFPMPSPRVNAALMVAAIPSLTRRMIQSSAFPAASSRKSRVAHATNLMDSGLVSLANSVVRWSADGAVDLRPAEVEDPRSRGGEVAL
jgi:hypothetical protein